jgi:hypothetical protein
MKRYFAVAMMSAAALVLSGLATNAALGQDKKADKGASKATIKVLQ